MSRVAPTPGRPPADVQAATLARGAAAGASGPPSLHHTESQVALMASPMRGGRVVHVAPAAVAEEAPGPPALHHTESQMALMASPGGRLDSDAPVMHGTSPLVAAISSARAARRKLKLEAIRAAQEAAATAELAEMRRLESVEEVNTVREAASVIEDAVDDRTRMLAPAVAGPCWVDMPPFEFLAHALLHQFELKLLTLCSAAAVLPGVVLAAVATNAVYDSRLEAGYDPSEEADIGDVLDSVKGSSGHIAYVSFYIFAALWSGWGVVLWQAAGVRALTKDAEPVRLRRWRATVALLPLCYGALFVVPSALLAASNVVFAVQLTFIALYAAEAARVTGWRQLRWLTLAVYAPIVAVLVLYSRVLPALMLSNEDSDLRLLVLRLVVHPLVVELCLFPLRIYGREFPGAGGDSLRLAACGTLGICNLYGRFMASTLRSWSSIVICVVGMSLQELALRATTLMRDEWYLWPALGRERARRYARSARSARVKADLLVVDQLTEDAGIFVAASWGALLRLSYNSTAVVPVATQLGSAAFQLAAEVVTDALPAVLSARARGTTIPSGRVASMLFRVKQAVANSHNSWLGHSRHHRALVVASVAHWAVFIARNNLLPNRTWCAVSREEVAGLNWWHQVPCTLVGRT